MNKKLNHAKLRAARIKPREFDPSKSVGRLFLDKVLTLFVISIPLAVLALWGNAQLETFRAKQREFERRQQVWTTLHTDFEAAYRDYSRACSDASMAYHRYLNLSSAAEAAHQRGVAEAVALFSTTPHQESDIEAYAASLYESIESMSVEDKKWISERTEAAQRDLIDSSVRLNDIIRLGVLYSYAYDRDDFYRFSDALSDWLVESVDNYYPMLTSINNDLLADATIYYESARAHDSRENAYNSLSLMMLDHSLRPSTEELDRLLYLQEQDELRSSDDLSAPKSND